MSLAPNTSGPPDLEKQADELCSLFSTTLHSLANDATAVRQLSSLAKVTGVLVEGQNDEENTKPNVQNNEYLKELRSIDSVVAAMEQKVVALRSIVVEEKKAIANFGSSLKEETDAQTMVLNRLIQAYTEIEANTSPPNEELTRLNLKPRRDSVDPRRDYQSRPVVRCHGDDEAYNQDHSNRIAFDPVLPKELKSISKNTLGRVQLIDLNEALEEIEEVVQNKFDSIPKFSSVPGSSSSVRQRRFEYLKQQRGVSYENIEVEAHAGHFWVSEQELRETCAFFRNGESTARAILNILCSLRRLKQIPGKKRQVTYLCLVQEDEVGEN
eukprot:scaffold721_cov131-Cylindrotheca_fusiformis.AAC.58